LSNAAAAPTDTSTPPSPPAAMGLGARLVRLVCLCRCAACPQVIAFCAAGSGGQRNPHVCTPIAPHPSPQPPRAPTPRRCRHPNRAVFLCTLVASVLLHAALALPSGFCAFVALAAVGEAVGAPVTLLADAAVMANAREVRPRARARAL
jgi:hypothetical protein